jgi:hypothetical protein
MYNHPLSRQLIDSGVWNYSDAVTTWIQALEDAGLDNWEGISEAVKIFKDMVQEELEKSV